MRRFVTNSFGSRIIKMKRYPQDHIFHIHTLMTRFNHTTAEMRCLHTTLSPGAKHFGRRMFPPVSRPLKPVIYPTFRRFETSVVRLAARILRRPAGVAGYFFHPFFQWDAITGLLFRMGTTTAGKGLEAPVVSTVWVRVSNAEVLRGGKF